MTIRRVCSILSLSVLIYARPAVAQHGFAAAHALESAARDAGDSLPDGRPILVVIDSLDPPAHLDTSPTSSEPSLRVLFLGNSLTYVNDVPAMFRSIAVSGLYRRVVTGMVAMPSATLTILAQGGTAARILAKMPWDYVVLQIKPVIRPQRGGIPSTTVANAFAAVDTTESDSMTQQFVRQAHAHRAQLILYAASQGAREDSLIRGIIDKLHTRLGQMFDIPVAHVGIVVHQVTAMYPKLWGRMFERDGVHPSEMGAYTAALVIYHTISRSSRVGPPYDKAPKLNEYIATILSNGAARDWKREEQ